MEEILDLARALGRAIASHPRFKTYREAARRLHDDAEARQALDAYNQAAAGIAEKEENAQPVEVAEKREFEDRRAKVASNETVKAFMRAQADYAELMRGMNDAIYGELGLPEETADDA